MTVLAIIKQLASEMKKGPAHLSIHSKSLWSFLKAAFRSRAERELLRAFGSDPNVQNGRAVAEAVRKRNEADAAFRKSFDRMQRNVARAALRPAAKKPRAPIRMAPGGGGAAKKKAAPRKAAKKAVKKQAIRSGRNPGAGSHIPLFIPRDGDEGGGGMSLDGYLPGNGNRFGRPHRPFRNDMPEGGGKRGGVTGSFERDLPVRKSGKPKAVACYTRIQIDSEVAIHMAAELHVTISLEKLRKQKHFAATMGAGVIDPGKQLAVTARGVLNFAIVGESKKNIEPPAPGAPAELDFHVVAVQEGKCVLAVDVWQGQAPVCSLELTTQCVPEVKNKPRKVSTHSVAPQVNPFPAEVNQIRIAERQVGNSCYYDFELKLISAREWRTFSSPEIKGDRERYVEKLYEDIDELWDNAGNSVKDFGMKLRNFGAVLFDNLFPVEMQQLLYRQAATIESIHVLSSEPFIPWELVLIKKPGMQHRWITRDKFLGELGLIRWLLLGWAPERLAIRKGRARYVIPEYSHKEYVLAGALEEKAFLEKNFSAKPIDPTANGVSAVLRKPGTFDLLHFCCHGEAETTNISNSKLLLQERKSNGKMIPTYLNQTDVEACGRINSKGSYPIIVLNACQAGRLGKGLAHYSGFASSFLRAGAAVFIGSLWSVEDGSAVAFITALYQSLLNGKTLSEAATHAREAARKSNDTSWISYVVYGHPFARLA